MIEKNWKEIIKPSKLEVREESKSENTSTIIAEPLERGYGVTIGNALKKDTSFITSGFCYNFNSSSRSSYMSFLLYQE